MATEESIGAGLFGSFVKNVALVAVLPDVLSP